MSSEKSIVPKKAYDIASPHQMEGMAKVLKTYVVKNQLYTTISGKNYVHVEGWQFAGGMMGLFPRIVRVENLSNGSELKWKSEAEIVNLKTGQVVSLGFAICSNKENKKKTFDEYAVCSMAQTRAIGKAYRNIIGWTMKLAGYQATPAEEMGKMGETPEQRPPQDIVPDKSQEPELELLCSVSRCDTPDLTRQEYDYSKKLYGKPMCRNCQKKAKPVKR